MQQIIPNDLTAVATYGICKIHILQEPGRAIEAVNHDYDHVSDHVNENHVSDSRSGKPRCLHYHVMKSRSRRKKFHADNTFENYQDLA